MEFIIICTLKDKTVRLIKKIKNGIIHISYIGRIQMKNIAIVEDQLEFALTIKEYIQQYSEKNNEIFNVVHFENANKFLENYKPIYAVVLMDIQLPSLNGMEASFKLREIDKMVPLIFITNLIQFAQRGYEVDAMGYLVKPVTYYDFSLKFKKALNLYMIVETKNITINTPNGLYRTSTDKIMYVEIINHRLYYHLVDNVVEKVGILKDVEKELQKFGFLRCNQCYLVNPKFIVSIKSKEIQVGNNKIQISRPKYNSFMTALTNWYAGQGNRK